MHDRGGSAGGYVMSSCKTYDITSDNITIMRTTNNFFLQTQPLRDLIRVVNKIIKILERKKLIEGYTRRITVINHEAHNTMSGGFTLIP